MNAPPGPRNSPTVSVFPEARRRPPVENLQGTAQTPGITGYSRRALRRPGQRPQTVPWRGEEGYHAMVGRLTPDQVAAYHEQGFVATTEPLLSEAEVERLRAALDEVIRGVS